MCSIVIKIKTKVLLILLAKLIIVNYLHKCALIYKICCPNIRVFLLFFHFFFFFNDKKGN